MGGFWVLVAVEADRLRKPGPSCWVAQRPANSWTVQTRWNQKFFPGRGWAARLDGGPRLVRSCGRRSMAPGSDLVSTCSWRKRSTSGDDGRWDGKRCDDDPNSRTPRPSPPWVRAARRERATATVLCAGTTGFRWGGCSVTTATWRGPVSAMPIGQISRRYGRLAIGSSQCCLAV